MRSSRAMVGLRYRVAVTLTASIVAASTVLAVLGKIDAERYVMLAVAVVAFWMPPPASTETDDKG